MNPSFHGGTFAGESKESGDGISYWDGDRALGCPRIKINVEDQRAYFYKGDQIVGVSAVSTGREGYNTHPGKFRITDKDIDHVSSLYGDYVGQNGDVVVQNVEDKKDPKPRGTVFRGAPMPYFLRLHGGIGMHAGYLPGYPASHGCIRLPAQMAIKFFEGAPVGTPVEIRQLLEQFALAGRLRRWDLAAQTAAYWPEVQQKILIKLDTATRPRARHRTDSSQETVNAIHRRPQFYNALTDNCTTNVRMHTAATTAKPAPWDWRMLLNGTVDELVYERGGFASHLPFAELKRMSLIDAKAQAANQAANFSELIRIGLPGFEQPALLTNP